MIAFTILGEPASKANSRQIVKRGNKLASIKSAKALDYETDALMQIPPAARLRLEGPLRITLRIFYATERPDLDESLILDILQDRYSPRHVRKNGSVQERQLIQRGVYGNDRQVREKHVFWGKDAKNPRCEVVIEPMDLQASLIKRIDGQVHGFVDFTKPPVPGELPPSNTPLTIFPPTELFGNLGVSGIRVTNLVAKGAPGCVEFFDGGARLFSIRYPSDHVMRWSED